MPRVPLVDIADALSEIREEHDIDDGQDDCRVCGKSPESCLCHAEILSDENLRRIVQEGIDLRLEIEDRIRPMRAVTGEDLDRRAR